MIAVRTALDAGPYPESPRSSGLAVADDGSWCVTHRGRLHGLTTSGERLWSVDLPERLPELSRDYAHHSCPVALAEGLSLVVGRRSAFIFTARGGLRDRLTLPDLLRSGRSRSDVAHFDDSGLAPSVSHGGRLLLTTVDGHVLTLQHGRLRSLGTYGYDLPPVAVLPDESFVVAGYYGKGLCVVHPNGTVARRLTLPLADTLPTVSRELVIAVSSDNGALLFALSGGALGGVRAQGLFAEYVDGGFVLQAQSRVVRLTADGKALWVHDFGEGTERTHRQPVVDAAGRIFVAVPGGVASLDEDGTVLWRVDAGAGVPGPLAMVGEGRIAFVLRDELVVVGPA